MNAKYVHLLGCAGINLLYPNLPALSRQIQLNVWALPVKFLLNCLYFFVKMTPPSDIKGFFEQPFIYVARICSKDIHAKEDRSEKNN